MQNDEVIWQIINYQFCSFKSKVAKERTFCQNPYNVTGLCIRSSCPLANSRYATIREEEGVCYLYLKTIERAHTPKDLWEKIKLPANYTKALELVSQQLEYFPKYLIHRNKQRLTKIHQMIIRMRKLKLKAKPKIVTTNTKVDRREIGKERKALRAAQLDKSIENELLERLKHATEGEIYNYPEQHFQKAIHKASSKFADTEQEDEEEEEFESGNVVENDEEVELEEEEEVIDEPYSVQYVEDFEPSDDEEDEDIEDGVPAFLSAGRNKARKASDSGIISKQASKRHKGQKSSARVDIEYEEEEDETSKAMNVVA